MGRGKKGRARPSAQAQDRRLQDGLDASGPRGHPHHRTIPQTDGPSATPSANTGVPYESCYITLTMAEVLTLIDAGMNLERRATFQSAIAVGDMYKSIEQSLTYILDRGRRPPMMNKATAVFVEQILAYRCKKKVIQPDLFLGFGRELCQGPGGRCACEHCGGDEEHEEEGRGGPGTGGSSGGQCKHATETAPPSSGKGSKDTTSSSKGKSSSSVTQRTAKGPMNKAIASQILAFGDGPSGTIPKTTGPATSAAIRKAGVASTPATTLPSLKSAPGQTPLVKEPSVAAALPQKVNFKTTEESKPDPRISGLTANRFAAIGPRKPKITSSISPNAGGDRSGNNAPLSRLIIEAASEILEKYMSECSESDQSPAFAMLKGAPLFFGGGTSITPAISEQLSTSAKRSSSSTGPIPGPSRDAVQSSEPSFPITGFPPNLSNCAVSQSLLSDQLKAEVAAVTDWIDNMPADPPPTYGDIIAVVGRIGSIVTSSDIPAHIRAIFTMLSAFLESRNEDIGVLPVFYAFDVLISGKWSKFLDLKVESSVQTAARLRVGVSETPTTRNAGLNASPRSKPPPAAPTTSDFLAGDKAQFHGPCVSEKPDIAPPVTTTARHDQGITRTVSRSTSNKATSSTKSSHPLSIPSRSRNHTSDYLCPPGSPKSLLQELEIDPDNIHVGNAAEAVRKLVAEVERRKKTEDTANALDEGVESSLAKSRKWSKEYHERMRAIEGAGEGGVPIAPSDSTGAGETKSADDGGEGEIDNEGEEVTGSLTKEWLETCQWASKALRPLDKGLRPSN